MRHFDGSIVPETEQVRSLPDNEVCDLKCEAGVSQQGSDSGSFTREENYERPGRCTVQSDFNLNGRVPGQGIFLLGVREDFISSSEGFLRHLREPSASHARGPLIGQGATGIDCLAVGWIQWKSV